MLEELRKHQELVRDRIIKPFDDEIEKAVYADTAENRKLGRVGQEYHRGRKKSGGAADADKKSGKEEKIIKFHAINVAKRALAYLNGEDDSMEFLDVFKNGNGVIKDKDKPLKEVKDTLYPMVYDLVGNKSEAMKHVSHVIAEINSIGKNYK